MSITKLIWVTTIPTTKNKKNTTLETTLKIVFCCHLVLVHRRYGHERGRGEGRERKVSKNLFFRGKGDCAIDDTQKPSQ